MNTTQKTDKDFMIIVGKALYVSQNQKKTFFIHNSNRRVIIMYRCVPNVTLLTLFCYLSPNSVSSKQRVFTQLCEKKAQLHLHLNSAALLLLRYI